MPLVRRGAKDGAKAAAEKALAAGKARQWPADGGKSKVEPPKGDKPESKPEK